MIKKLTLYFLLGTLLPLSLLAQFEKIDRWLEEQTPQMGGRSVLVIYKNGKVVYSKSVNDMSRRQKLGNKMIARRSGAEANTVDFTATTKQPIASCSKWLSAALVMTFVDEGKLKTSDTIGRWLPQLSASGKGAITIGQCLSHLTGIDAPSLKESLTELKDFHTMDDAVNAIAQLPMEALPGTSFHYSNAGLQLAAAVIEEIGGKNFQTLFYERIAQPLQMKSTDFGNAAVPLAAGGARSTPEDYIHFLSMILNKGMYRDKRILSPESIAEMQFNRVGPHVTKAYVPAEAGDFGYGYGEWVMSPSSVSSPGLFGSFPWVDNKKGYCAFLMCYSLQSKGRHERYTELKKLVDEAL